MSEIPPAARALIQQTAATAGDGCSLCHRTQLWNGEQTTIGLFRGKPRQTGECCQHKLRSVVSVGIYYGSLNRPWVEDDHEWFRAHPRRSHRLRRAFNGETVASIEIEAKGKNATGRTFFEGELVVVVQLRPGMRRRVQFSVTDRAAGAMLDSAMRMPDPQQETFAHALAREFIGDDGCIRQSAVLGDDVLRKVLEWCQNAPAASS